MFFTIFTDVNSWVRDTCSLAYHEILTQWISASVFIVTLKFVYMYYSVFNDAIVSFIKSPKRTLETHLMAMHEFLIYNHYSLHKLVHHHLSNNVCILIIGVHACSKFGIIASMNFQINNEYCYYWKKFWKYWYPSSIGFI